MATQWPLSRPFKRHITFYLHEMEWNCRRRKSQRGRGEEEEKEGEADSEVNGGSGELNDSGNESRSSNIYPMERERQTTVG